MAQFSESEINDAKRRVRDMKNRASRYVNDNGAPAAPGPQIPYESQPQQERQDEKSDEDKNEQDNSFIIILALLLILSREGADNKLLLALLYLLL